MVAEIDEDRSTVVTRTTAIKNRALKVHNESARECLSRTIAKSERNEQKDESHSLTVMIEVLRGEDVHEMSGNSICVLS
jgi:hypothetical protein